MSPDERRRVEDNLTRWFSGWLTVLTDDQLAQVNATLDSFTLDNALLGVGRGT